MSQLIRRLRRDLACATQASDRIELSAKLALQLARIGNFQEARQNIEQARGLFVDGRGGLGTVWIMLAEALVHFFEQQSPQARIRISAAHVLAEAIGHSQLIAMTSAWKAHIEFENSDFSNMVKSLRAAFLHATETDLDANTRSAIVLFNAFSTSGDMDKANGWFSRAHANAIKNGDQASVDALLFNKAVLIQGHLRVKKSANCLNEGEVERVRLEFMSSRNLNSLTGISALANHLPLADARLLMLEGNFERAIDLLHKTRYETPFSINNFNQSYIDLEICFCNYNLQRFVYVENYLRDNPIWDFADLDLDEEIVSVWMRLQMAGRYVSFGEPSAMQLNLVELCSKYFASRTALVDSLKMFATV